MAQGPSPETLESVLSRHNNEDSRQLYLGRFLSIRFAVMRDHAGYLIAVEKGKVVSVAGLDAGNRDQAVFAISASAEAWGTFSQDIPPPGYQDIMAMIMRGYAKLTGDALPLLVNLFFFRGVINGLRQVFAR